MRKKSLLVLALAAAAAAAWRGPLEHAASIRPEVPPVAPPAASLPGFQARAPLAEPRGNLFAAPPAPAVRAGAPPPKAAPAAPAMPYRVAGSVVRDGVATLLLARGDEVIAVAVGQTLQDGYRVESIDAEEITLLYLPLGARERLPLLAGAASPRPAQLRWQGPERVKAGAPFSVALHVTSEEPLRASPLQLSFDAEVLEPIEVRPGKLFSEGFAYRIDAAGSIDVGASGRARADAHAAADAELVVFVFKPLRPAAATELKLAPPLLQGAVGKPIAVGELGAYRTAITP